MIKKHYFTQLATSINKELRLANDIKLFETSKGYFTQSRFYKYSFLKVGAIGAMAMYPKIKNAKAMQEFERVHKANCVLGKRLGKWVIQINF